MPTTIKELQYKICHASKQPLVHMDYDVTACYDRIGAGNLPAIWCVISSVLFNLYEGLKVPCSSHLIV